MSNYGLTAENFLKALPEVLRQDENISALAAAVAEALEKELATTELIRLYPAIDQMPGALLDILASDFKVDWWNGNWPLERKRQSLKDSWSVHKRLGTPDAVKLAMQAAFGAGTLKEWFTYDGDPHHFRVTGLSPEMAQTGYESFLKLLDTVKRASSVLEAVVMEGSKEETLRSGFGAANLRRVTIYCETPPLFIKYLVDEDETMLADENNATCIE